MAFNHYQMWENKGSLRDPSYIDKTKIQLLHVQNLMQDFPGPDNVFRYAGLFDHLRKEFDLEIIELLKFFNLAIKEKRALTPEWILTTGYDMIGRK